MPVQIASAHSRSYINPAKSCKDNYDYVLIFDLRVFTLNHGISIETCFLYIR